jgi:hypothetical protein
MKETGSKCAYKFTFTNIFKAQPTVARFYTATYVMVLLVCWTMCVPPPKPLSPNMNSSGDPVTMQECKTHSHEAVTLLSAHVSYISVIRVTLIRNCRRFTWHLRVNCILPLCSAEDQTSVTGRSGRIFITRDFCIYCSLRIVRAIKPRQLQCAGYRV